MRRVKSVLSLIRVSRAFHRYWYTQFLSSVHEIANRSTQPKSNSVVGINANHAVYKGDMLYPRL